MELDYPTFELIEIWKILIELRKTGSCPKRVMTRDPIRQIGGLNGCQRIPRKKHVSTCGEKLGFNPLPMTLGILVSLGERCCISDLQPILYSYYLSSGLGCESLTLMMQRRKDVGVANEVKSRIYGRRTLFCPTLKIYQG